MDIPKTALIKSRSSNEAEAKKNTQKNEKVSRSNAEFQPRTLCTGFQPLMLKKRGVYVEKKPTKLSINQSEQSPDVLPNPKLIRPRAMPRPNKKRFLTSVLTILSKSTAGTQYPDDTEGTGKPDKIMNKQKIKKDEEDIREEWTTAAPNIAKKKPKYRSKILNNSAYKDSFTVLQSKKQQSSSNNSEYVSVKCDADENPETIKWPKSLPPLNQENDGTTAAASHSKKDRLIAKESEPSMVTDSTKLFDKGSYDFFEDRYQTTMNLESLDPESHRNEESLKRAIHSKVSLQSKVSLIRTIDVEKLEESESQTFKLSRTPSSLHGYSIMPDERDEFTNRQMLEHFQSQLSNYRQSNSPTRTQKRKPKTDSFQYKKVNPLPKTTSPPLPNKKKITKHNAKKDFLKILKEELQMKSNETFEEPENFFQALKVMARNKKCSQEWKSEVSSDPDDHICHFQPRRVLSKKSTGKQSGYRKNPVKKRKAIRYDYETDYSHHSLEVTGYDYEEVKKPKKIRKETPTESAISTLSIPPTPTNDEYWTDFCDSDASPMLTQRQYVLDKLMQLEI